MLPTLTLRQLNTAGQTQQGLVDDVSTRSLLTVRVGEGAGKLSTGLANAFVGYEAGKIHNQGSYVTFIGYQAGEQNANASYGTFVGAYAGRQNQRGNENVFVGYRTGERNISGSDCVAVGAYAMRDNASGNFSVAIGYSAGERCLDGSFNTMVGAEAGQDNRSGNFNTMTGYRSGRSAFQGNYNTYFGAYAGYSNNRGNENCFIGYRSGEALEQGNLNIAIGAYSMAKATLGHSNISIGPYSAMFNRGSGNILVGWNAGSSNYTGELNVIVGVEAGTSNQGSRNVLIGYKSASYWKGDCNVLIGSEVSQNGSGFNSVIIGYKSGGFNYRDGERNIFIGAGSDAIQSNVSDAISIGTYNVTTTSESLSIGKNIQNAGINSVSLGFSIETNAENSVLVGKDLIITSAIYFKDPLNLSLASVVLKDASEKFGIQQINYTNYVLGTSNNPHETAEFGYNTSNTFNTITLPRRNRISPDSYDLQNYMGYYAIARGCNLFYTHSSCNIAVSIEEIASKNIQSFVFYGSNIPIQSTAVIQGNTFLTNHTTSNQETFYGEVIHNSTFDIFSMILNISLFDTYQYAYPIHVAKHHAIPILHLTIPSQSISSYLLNNTPVTLNQLTSTVTFSTNGILLSSNTSFVVDTPPKYGTLNRIHVNQLNEWNYQPLRSSMFVKEDSFTIFPTTYVYDNDSNLYGISSNSVHQIQLPYQNEIILYRNDVHQPNHVIRFDCNMILWIKNGSYESTQYSNIQINGFDERYQLHYQNQIYTCNQALHQPIFQTHTLACNITVDKDNYRFVLENNPLIPLNNQLTFYIGNTYQIAQYNVSNVGYPLRFSALPEGPEYSCNVTRNGTIGTNGYLTITITNSTPNPLYYYASERPSMGGSIPIASIPTIPLSIPYDRFLNNTVYLSPLNIVSSPISPLKFKITTDTWSCNITIPFNESKDILWEDTDDTTSSIVQLTKPIVYYYGPLKTASNIFIESSTSNGILTWVNTSNSLQNIQYQPLSPWESKQDSATFLLQKSNNVQQVKRFTWNLSNVVYPIVSSNYWIDFPTSNVEISTIRVQKNNFSQTSNVSLSNTIRIEKIHYNLNQTIQSSSVQIIVQPIDSYLQSYGLSNVMSNLTIQSNIDIRLNLDHNKVIHIYENSNLFITYNQTSNTLITCNIEILQTSENDVLPHSNIVIRFKDSTVIQQSKSYNSNFDVYHKWNTTSNIYDTISKTLIYTTQSIYPIETSNFIQRYETPDFSNVKSFTYSNYDRQTNYNVFENLMPVNRTTLFEPNTLITTILSSAPNTYRTVLKNIGEVTTYHSSNITLGTLYFKTLRPNTLGTFSTYTYTYTVGQQTKHLIIPKYSTLSTNTITIPTYRSRTNQQWIVLDSKYQGTLVNWETYARAQALLSFIPDTLYIVHCANGFISSNQEIIHRIPLANLNSSSYIYQATNRYENDTWTYFYGRESTGQCSTIYRNVVFLKYTPISSSYTISSRLSKWNPLTSNILYTTAPEEPTNLLRIQFPTLAQINTFVELYNYPNHALINNTLTWSQITSNNIYFKTKSDYAFDMETLSIDLPYRVLSSTSAILEENTLRIHVIDFTDFPQPNKSIYGVIEHLDFLENTHQTTLNGYLKSIVLNYIDKGGYLNPENLEFIITYPLQYGCLIHSDFKTQLIRRFTYNDLLLNKLVYIPYNPNEIQHDVLYFRWLFQDRISPEYNVILKNYLLKQSIYSITPYRIKDTYRQFNWKQKAILSKGLLSDISSNVVTLSPSIISCLSF